MPPVFYFHQIVLAMKMHDFFFYRQQLPNVWKYPILTNIRKKKKKQKTKKKKKTINFIVIVWVNVDPFNFYLSLFVYVCLFISLFSTSISIAMGRILMKLLLLDFST